MTDDDRHEPERLTPAPPIADASAATRLRGALVGIGPLRRHREYRLLYAAQTITGFGSMVTFVAIPYQAYAISHSSFIVGAVSAVQLVPLVAMALFGGALADAVDRRLLVRLTEAAFAICSTLLLVNATFAHPMLWLLFVIGALMAGLEGLQRPPLDALTPRLVDRDEIAQASVLNSIRSNAAAIAGPAIGGVLIAGVGLPAAYGFDLGTFAFSLALLSAMRATPPPSDAEPPSVRRVLEGLRYARRRPELLGTYGVDFVAMFFGMPLALMPALATHLGGARALGFLYAAPSLGALVSSLFGGWTIRVYRHGAAVCLAAIGWGLGIVVLAFAPDLASRWWLSPWRDCSTSSARSSAAGSGTRRSLTGCAGGLAASSRSRTRRDRCSATSSPASSPRWRACVPRSPRAGSCVSSASAWRR